MKTNREAVQSVLEKARKMRKTKRLKTLLFSASCAAVLLFLVAFSGIVTWRPTLYPNSYKNYLIPYATVETTEKKLSENTAMRLEKTENSAPMYETNDMDETDGKDEVAIPEATLRFIDKDNAVVSLGERAYPCRLRATSKNTFTLDVVGENASEGETDEETDGATDGNTDVTDEETVIEEAPNAFRVEFWEDGANLSWSIGGITFQKVLSVTDEYDIPAGLWVSYATATLGGAPQLVSGGNWTLIFEDGTSYVGEGTDTYLSKFLSVYNVLFQCIFDSQSGFLLDASLCTYDTETFDFPTLKERYLSDADESYEWFKFIPDDEKLPFTGATFQAAGVTYESNDYTVAESDVPHKDAAAWRLVPRSSQELALLDVGATLQLTEDGKARLTVTGDRDYRGEAVGKWYPLYRHVLVVLDEKTPLTGKAFTLYVETAGMQGDDAPTQEALERTALSYLNSYDFYRIGYHTFEYHSLEESVKIFWGAAWEKDFLLPVLQYEKTYVLNGSYLPAAFSNGANADNAGTALEPIADNGNLTLVFHENGTVTVTRLDTESSVTVGFTNDHDQTYDFAQPVTVWLNGETSVNLKSINAEGGYLIYEWVGYTQTSGYRTYLIYRFDLVLSIE